MEGVGFADFSGFADFEAEGGSFFPPEGWDRSEFVGDETVPAGSVGALRAWIGAEFVSEESAGFGWSSFDFAWATAC